MNRSTELAALTNDLAGHWTEPVLEMLKAAGVPYLSVDVELAAWHVLKKVLRSELRWRQAFQVSTLVSLRTLMDRVMRRATEHLVMGIRPASVTPHFRVEIRRLIRDHRATPAELRLYARIARHPDLHAALKLPSRSDFTPRLRVAGAPV